MTSSGTALANRLTVEEVVRVYRECEETIRGAFAQIAAAEARLNATFAGADGYRTIHVNAYRRTISFTEPDDVLVRMRHEVWRALVERLEVRRMMSIARWNELERQIDERQLPEITEETVAQLAEGFRDALPEMLCEAVAEVFEWLRPHRTEYKRNSEYEVPRRIALSGVVEQWPWGIATGSPFRVRHHAEQNLIALEGVLHALDGRGQIAKTHYSAISNAIKAPEFRGRGETELFEFRAYKNGSLHVTFKREDLLARFNQIAGGARLRSAEAAE